MVLSNVLVVNSPKMKKPMDVVKLAARMPKEAKIAPRIQERRAPCVETRRATRGAERPYVQT